MPYDFLPNRLLFLKYQIIPGIPQSPNNAKHNPPTQIFQTYNDYLVEDLVIDVEDHRRDMALPSSSLSKQQFYSRVSKP
jgi:hypothetical protein